MCVIFTVQPGATLTEEEISAAGLMNSDGWGIAWPEKQNDGETLVRWIKGLPTESVFDITKHLESSTYIAHARLATAGGDSEGLTHPFPVTSRVGLATEGLAKRVLFHNGHWMEWEDILKAIMQVKQLEGSEDDIPDGIWSDSRLLAFMLARYDLKEVEKAFARAGKVAVLGPKEIATYGSFVKVRKGIQASNNSWDWDDYSTGYTGNTKYSSGLCGAHGNTIWTNNPERSTTYSNPKVYDAMPTNILVGDIVQLDSSRDVTVAEKYHGLCVKLLQKSFNYSRVEAIDGNKLERLWFPNCSIRKVTENMNGTDDWTEDEDFFVTGPKVAEYVQYARIADDQQVTDSYGRVVRRYKIAGDDNLLYDIWDATLGELHTIKISDIIERFPNTKAITKGKDSPKLLKAAREKTLSCYHGIELIKPCPKCKRSMAIWTAAERKEARKKDQNREALAQADGVS